MSLPTSEEINENTSEVEFLIVAFKYVDLTIVRAKSKIASWRDIHVNTNKPFNPRPRDHDRLQRFVVSSK